MKPFFSIIIPLYNKSEYVTETIKSALNQSFNDFEIIVANDGSTDNSEEVVQALAKKDTRIRYIYQDNKGLPGARNTGIQNAKGIYLQFLDSDDLLQSRKLERQKPAIDFDFYDLTDKWLPSKTTAETKN